MSASFFVSVFSITSLFVPYLVIAQASPSPVPPQVTAIPIQPPPIRICPYENVILRPGTSGGDVKALQSLLAQDSAVYPQGLTTGYYGKLTEEAVKKLQGKVGLPSSGILDDDTRKIIFPCATLRVVSPNGGEVWKVGETQLITWEVAAPYILREPSAGAEGSLREVVPQKGAAIPGIAIYPYYPHLSIDLIRTDIVSINFGSTVVYHIGGASLYGEKSFKWTIPSSIPELRAYKVRISVWKNVPEPIPCNKFERICPLAPEVYPLSWRGYLWDESDAEFAILGGKPEPSPLPTPPIDYSKLKVAYQQLLEAVSRLQSALRIIEEILNFPR